jgi:hypothetical protein
VLEAAYEATVCAAIVNARTHGTHTVFLTLLGGGVFGNDTTWILAGLRRALHLYQQAALDVVLVSYGASQPAVHHLAQHLQHEAP